MELSIPQIFNRNDDTLVCDRVSFPAGKFILSTPRFALNSPWWSSTTHSRPARCAKKGTSSTTNIPLSTFIEYLSLADAYNETNLKGRYGSWWRARQEMG